MIPKNDISAFSLARASMIIGPELKIESFIIGLLKDLRKQVPAKRVRIFLWDDTINKFYLEVASDSAEIVNNPAVTDQAFYRAGVLKTPLYIGSRILVPLHDQGKFLGLLVFEKVRDMSKLHADSRLINDISRMAGIACSNVRILVSSERRNQDMFKFSVLSRALNTSVHEEEIVKILTQGMEWIIKTDVYGFLILDKHSSRIYIRSDMKLQKSTLGHMKRLLVSLSANFIREKLDISKLEERIDIGSRKAGPSSIRSYVNVPLITRDKVIGLLCIMSFKKNNFDSRDQQNLTSLASHGAVAFENARLYDDLKRTYFSIVSTLTSAIEAKDPYTQGHSVLVSKFAVAIARAMNLSYSMIESIQIAGLLHDLGKLGVPEDILLKKDKLTFAEYEVVKSHPEIALKILGPVEFPHFVAEAAKGQDRPEMTLSLFETADLSEEVKLMIFYHHERYSGGGYPKGLKSDEIPIGARIMAVADTFEALTADRPYRKAFGIDEACKILIKVRGEQLDPRIVNVFLNLIKDKGIEFLRSGKA
jgi:HD-GYP domain-containing protein (c-di-GMP phosphodiesterase class II)